MVYNLSPKSVERMQSILDQLLPGKELRLSTEYPHKLAYRIREAIAAAKHHKLSPYDRLEFVFTLGEGFVQAKPKVDLISGISAPAQVVEGFVSEFDVVANAGKSHANEIRFPGFSGDFDAVERWAAKAGWKVTGHEPLSLQRANG